MSYLLLIWGVLKSPTATVLDSICAFQSFKECLMKLGALTLGAYRLIIVISFWCICPFINMEHPSLSRLINVSLKLICLRIYCYSCLPLGVIGLLNLLPDFHPKPVLVSVNELGLM
jgi:hypothetical protein